MSPDGTPTQASPEIRLATIDDLEALVMMGAMFHTESPFNGRVAYDPDRVRDLIIALIEAPEGVVFVADVEGDPVGAICGIKTCPWFSSAPLAQEVAWFLDPDFRSGRTGLRLLRAFEQWAIEEGVDGIVMSDFEGTSVGAVLRNYQPVERACVRWT